MPDVDPDTFDRVRKVLVDTLGADGNEVVLGAKLVDLGADSFGFIEIVCGLEKEFELDKSQGSLSLIMLIDVSELEVEHWIVSQASIDRLKQTNPHFNLSEWEKHAHLGTIGLIFTVWSACVYVERRIKNEIR